MPRSPGSNRSRKELIELLTSYQRDLELEKRYHLILDNMIEGFQLLDFNFVYLYVNDTVVKQSRFSREELIGHSLMEKYPGIESTTVFQTLNDSMLNRVAHTVENYFTYPDGKAAWFRLSIQPVEEGLFILSMDITEQKKAEIEKEQHIDDIEQLLYKISHEVRQPVCHILGIMDLLNKSLISPDELQQVLSLVKESVQKMDDYTRELTDFVSDMKMNADNDRPYKLRPGQSK